MSGRLKNIFVVILYKGSENPKSRLGIENGGFLYPHERRKFSDALITDLYGVWTQTLGDRGKVIVAIGDDSRGDVKRYKEKMINTCEMPSSDINESLRIFQREAKENGYEAFGVSGCDLPLITQADIHELLMKSESFPVVFSLGRRGGTTTYVITNDYKIELYKAGSTNLENQISRLKERKIKMAAKKTS